MARDLDYSPCLYSVKITYLFSIKIKNKIHLSLIIVNADIGIKLLNRQINITYK